MGELRAAEERVWRNADADPTDHRIGLPGSGVEVRVQEVGTGPAVLFVHGGSNSGTSWARSSVGCPGSVASRSTGRAAA